MSYHCLAALEFALFPRSDAVVAVSGPLVRSRRRFGVARERIRVIPNGWNRRLLPVKGADVFLDALARLSNLSVRVSIIGDGARIARARLETEFGP